MAPSPNPDPASRAASDPRQRLAVAPDVLVRRYGDVVLVCPPLNLSGGMSGEHAADPELWTRPLIVRIATSAIAVWDELAQPVTLDAIAARLADRFGSEVAVVRSDVEHLVRQWREARIVETVA